MLSLFLASVLLGGGGCRPLLRAVPPDGPWPAFLGDGNDVEISQEYVGAPREGWQEAGAGGGGEPVWAADVAAGGGGEPVWAADVAAGGGGEPVWAADVAAGPLLLRRATAAETRWFNGEIGPLIQRAEQTPRHVIPSDRPTASLGREEQPAAAGPAPQGDRLYRRIVTLVNKFIMVAGADRGQALSGEHLDPTITVFARGGYTAVLIQFGSQHWQIFLRPPSPLPHEGAGAGGGADAGGGPVPLSDSVKEHLYSKLLRYFTVSLRFDI